MGFLFALKFTVSRCPFPFLERNFFNATYLKPAIKIEQSASCAVWTACCAARAGWFLSLQRMMKIQGWHSLSLLRWESCFLSNLFLLSLLLSEVMQLFIHTESTRFLGFDREISDFGEVLQHISASTVSVCLVRCCIPVWFLQWFYLTSSIFLT